MIDTQAAMNLGQDSISEVEKWLDKTEWEIGNDPVIDPLFGCSTRLPRLMVSKPGNDQSYREYTDRSYS